MMRLLSTFCLGVLLIAGCMTPPEHDLENLRSSPADTLLYRAEAGAIRTDDDELLFLRGVNLSQVSKDGPDYLYPFTSDDGAVMLAHGFNSVRLLVLWEALMPESPDELDRAYLDEIVHQIWLMESLGLRVVVDMHQDLWGAPFGDGAPPWTCPEELRQGYEPQSPWWRNYMTPQVSGCFDHFWESDELRGHFAAAWTEVARAVCHHRNVVGFDLINEPWPGTSFGAPSFEEDVLFPFYFQVMDSIEAVCPGRLFFLEPLVTFMFGLTTPVEIPEELLDRVVLAPHYYPPEVHEPGEGYQGDVASLEANLQELFGDMMEGGSPLWIGEWGGISDNPRFDDYARDFSEILLRRSIGSALWEYSRGATSFSLLDRAGSPRDAFESFRQMPTPTLLPSPPSEIDPQWDRRTLRLGFRCRPEARVSLVLPGQGSGSCQADPSDALEMLGALPGFFNARCRADQEVVLSCRSER